ncbi:hypothetical protein HWV62_34073, partial [Athelia sp. TMB]
SISYSPPRRTQLSTPTRARSRSKSHGRGKHYSSDDPESVREPAALPVTPHEQDHSEDSSSASTRPLASRIGLPSLSTRVNTTAPPPYHTVISSANRARHQGLNRPRNISSWALHGSWTTFKVDTVEAAKQLLAAATYDNQALLYLDYCNSIFQTPNRHRSEGIQYVISRWNEFLLDHRERRDRLRQENDVPFRPAGTRSRRPPRDRDRNTRTLSKTEAPLTQPTTQPSPEPEHSQSVPSSPLPASMDAPVVLDSSDTAVDQDMETNTTPDSADTGSEWSALVPPTALWLSSPIPVATSTHTVTSPQSSDDEVLDYGDDTDVDETRGNNGSGPSSGDNRA